MKIDFANSQIDHKNLENIGLSLKPYINYLAKLYKEKDYKKDEASLLLPSSKKAITQSQELVNQFKAKSLKYIIIIGIGGSNLGTKAIYDAIFGNQKALLNDAKPQLIFIDTTSSLLLNSYLEIFNQNIANPSEIVINVITKSGTTLETIACFNIIYNYFQKRFKNLVNNQIVITTTKNSKIWKLATKKSFKKLAIPNKVGGRFSVFSNVGIFPLMLAGINVKDLLSGANLIAKNSLEYNPENNLALKSAVITYFHYKNNIQINNSFFFNPEFESIGKWNRQLMAESLGKKHNLQEEAVNTGIVPIVSIGSTDLHSMAQLFYGGPKNIYTNLIYGINNNAKILKVSSSEELILEIKNKSIEEIMQVIFNATVLAYKKNNLPFTKITLTDNLETSIGKFLQFKMLEVMFIGKLLNVNTFDQPNVEDYKQEIKQLLN